MARSLSRAATRRSRQLNDQSSLTPQQTLEIARARALEGDTMIAAGTLSSTSEASRKLQIVLRRFVQPTEPRVEPRVVDSDDDSREQLCRQGGKRFIRLRSAGATSLLAALQRPEVAGLADAVD